MEINRYSFTEIQDLRDVDVSLDQLFTSEVLDICQRLKKTAQNYTARNNGGNGLSKGWRDSHKHSGRDQKSRFSVRQTTIGEMNPAKKVISLLLNKLSDSNKESIQGKLIQEINQTKDKEVMCFLIDKLFQCASIQVNFCSLYAEVCSVLHQEIESVNMSEYIEGMIHGKMSDLEKYRNSSTLQSYDDFCEDLSWKNRHKGFYQLLTHFYIKNLLDISKLQDVLLQIKSLILAEDNLFKTEVLIESLSMVLKTIAAAKTINVYHKKTIVHISKTILEENREQMNMRSRCILEQSIEHCQ
jgi:hypothetical protein